MNIDGTVSCIDGDGSSDGGGGAVDEGCSTGCIEGGVDGDDGMDSDDRTDVGNGVGGVEI